jgi:hypothetical protein
MQSAIVVKRLGAVALLLSIFSSLSVSAAFAADIPSLYWERGRQQTITLGGESAENKWSIRLVGPGKVQNFKKSSANKNGFFVYSVDIPRNQKLGEYRVLISSADRVDEVVSYVTISKAISYNLLGDPEALGVLAVVLTTILSSFSINRSNLGGSDGFEAGNPDDPAQEVDNTGNIESIGSEVLVTSDTSKGPLDELRLARIPIVASLDATRHSWIQVLAPRSRAWMRIIADASWLQAIVGPLAIVTPILGLSLGFTIYALGDFSSSVIPALSPALVALFALGIFDAFAGALGGLTLLVSIIATGNLHTTADLRGLLGLTVIFFLPVLIAGTTRPLRRQPKFNQPWERATDYLIAPIISFWAIKSLITAIDGFTQQETELAQSATTLALLSSTLILVRLLCEDFAQRIAPARIEYLSAPNARNMDGYYQGISICVKVLIYLFFMYGFLQYSWQGFVAITFLILPQVIKIYADKVPNFPILFQIIPGGVPGVVFTAVLGFTVSNWINSLPLVAEDKSRTIFVLVAIPGFILSILKILGRAPKEGDIRWYRRPRYTNLYRTGGVLMFAAALSLVSGAVI